MPANDAVAVIDLKIHSIRQLFNSLDATPFPDNDLDTNAEEFIVGWAKELPPDQRLQIRVQLTQPGDDPQKIAGVESAFHNFFEYRAGVVQRQFRQLMREGRISLMIGLTCLAVALVAAEFISQYERSAFSSVLRESLIIGGWVGMWRSIQIFLFDWWPIRHHRNICTRLSQAPVQVLTAGSSQAPPAPPQDAGPTL